MELPIIKLNPNSIYSVICETIPIEACLTQDNKISFSSTSSKTVSNNYTREGIANEKKVFQDLLKVKKDIVKPPMAELIIERGGRKYLIRGQCDGLCKDFAYEIKTKISASINPYPNEQALCQLECYLRLYEKERGFIVESKNDKIKFTSRYRDDILFNFMLEKVDSLYDIHIHKMSLRIPSFILTDKMVEKIRNEIELQYRDVVAKLFEHNIKRIVHNKLMNHLKPIVEENIEKKILETFDHLSV